MPSSKFAAWLRVTPPPTTLAESSAIYKHLKSQGRGRASVFIRAKADANASDKEKAKNANIATYYTVFSHQPPNSPTIFDVPVYHNLPAPRDQDPFNIRGLQDRKPFPPPKTFACWLETAGEDDSYGEQIKRDNPYHGSFKVAPQDWLQDVYGETGAPPGVKQGLGLVLKENDVAREAEAAAEAEHQNAVGKSGQNRKLKMNSLMNPWYEAMGVDKSQMSQKTNNDAAAKLK